MKILITGATGFLGARALNYLRQKYEVTALPSSLLRGVLTAERVRQLETIFTANAPDIVLHTAAISDTNYAQQHPEESYLTNVLLPQTLAQITASIGGKFVFCSSDQVYGGCEGLGPFMEIDPLAPANVYGQHKLEAETLVTDSSSEAVSLRLTWMYDLPGYQYPTRANLLIKLLTAAMKREPLKLSTSDYRGVTYVWQIIENLPRVFAMPGGVYNYGSESVANTWEIAQAWRSELNLNDLEILPVAGKQRSLCMDCGKSKAEGIRFEDSVSGIRRCIHDYGLDKL